MLEKYEERTYIDYLSNHIKMIESIRNHILREFYSEQTEERDSFENLIDEYIKNIKNIKNIINITRNKDLSDHWPLVLIGSVVEIENLECSETEALKIVPPFYQDKGTNLECASCLSPVGNALLLKKIGDKINVETPLGDFSLKIKSIELPSA
jgi:transcription elongation factor GreA